MKLGFIGCGNMAKAMIKGIIASGAVAPGEIYGSNVTPEHAAAVAEEFGINAGTNNITVAENADILFLSVKPYQYEAVIAEIRGAMRPEQTVVTIADVYKRQPHRWHTSRKNTERAESAMPTPALNKIGRAHV